MLNFVNLVLVTMKFADISRNFGIFTVRITFLLVSAQENSGNFYTKWKTIFLCIISSSTFVLRQLELLLFRSYLCHDNQNPSRATAILIVLKTHPMRKLLTERPPRRSGKLNLEKKFLKSQKIYAYYIYLAILFLSLIFL